MTKLKLTLACGRYDRTQPLIDGRVVPEGVDLTFIPLVRAKLFGACSITASSTFPKCRCRPTRSCVRKAIRGSSPFRSFRRACFVIRRSICAPIPRSKSRRTCKGKRVGVADYQMTAAVWVRGFLMSEYGVAPKDVTWVIGRPVRTIKPPEGIRHRAMPADTTLEAMLERGEIDALASVDDSQGAGHDHAAAVSAISQSRKRVLRTDRHFPDHAHVRAEKAASTSKNPGWR